MFLVVAHGWSLAPVPDQPEATAGCPANESELPPAGPARVDGQLTVDGVGIAVVTISFRDTANMNVETVVTQDRGLYTTTLGAPGSWLGSVQYGPGDCPARSIFPQECDELSVHFPCVSRDVDIGGSSGKKNR